MTLNRLYKSYRIRAEKRGHPFEIHVNDFRDLTTQDCHYCKKPPLQGQLPNHWKGHLYNGLDRKDNSKGYILSNVVPCCQPCNFLKGKHLTYEEMVIVSQVLKDHRAKLSSG